MIVMIGGTRGFRDRDGVINWAKSASLTDIYIHGDCYNSPDRWAGDKLHELGAVVGKFPYVDRFGKCGGHLRNRAMVDLADKCVFFWNGTSQGTEKTIEYAKSKSKEVIIIKPQ
jgi:hypothetical protein